MIGRFVRMNDVFERYVTRWMQEQVRGDYQVFGQGERRGAMKLCHDGHDKQLYKMRPGIRIVLRSSSKEDCVAILDAKWKPPREDGKLASGGDLYQMFAYASHWLNGPDHEVTPRLIGLIYPTTNELETSHTFLYPKLAGVTGRSLRFHLPRRTAEGRWREGLLVNRVTREMTPYLPAVTYD